MGAEVHGERFKCFSARAGGIEKRDQASTGARKAGCRIPGRVSRRGFGARLDHVGEFVVGARIGFEQAVEGRIDVVLGAVFQQAVDHFGQLAFPESCLPVCRRIPRGRWPGVAVLPRRAKGDRASRSGCVSWVFQKIQRQDFTSR
jgi:hypothetical protein